MKEINSIPQLLKIANVSELTVDTLAKVLQAITNNRLQLNNQALEQVTSLLKSSSSAVTIAYEAIQTSTQKANSNNDKLSLEYIEGLLNVFKASGVSDERISTLLEKIEEHEYEIRLEKTKGNNSLGKMALGVFGLFGAIVLHNKTEKRSFWEK